MAAVGHAAKSPRFSVTLLAPCIAFFMMTESTSQETSWKPGSTGKRQIYMLFADP